MKRTDYITPSTDLLNILHHTAVLAASIDIDYGGSEEEGTADTRHQVLWADDEE